MGRQIIDQVGLPLKKGVMVGRVERHPVVIRRLWQSVGPGDGMVLQRVGQGVGDFEGLQTTREQARKCPFHQSLNKLFEPGDVVCVHTADYIPIGVKHNE